MFRVDSSCQETEVLPQAAKGEPNHRAAAQVSDPTVAVVKSDGEHAVGGRHTLWPLPCKCDLVDECEASIAFHGVDVEALLICQSTSRNAATS